MFPSCQMPRLPKLQPRAFSAVFAALLALHLLAVMAMAGLTHLHELAHADAHDEEHQCAVTLYQYGLLDAGAAAPQAPRLPEPMVATPVRTLCAVALPAPCLTNGVLEHGPPVA